MTTLYFMRHGFAEAGSGKPDEARNLTPDGVRRVEAAAPTLTRLVDFPLTLLCSPRNRAQQTARIVGEALDMPPQVDLALDFSFDLAAVERFVASDTSRGWMFVGHEPTMSGLVHLLSGARVTMQPGTVAAIELYQQNPMQGELLWLLPSMVFAVTD